MKNQIDVKQSKWQFINQGLSALAGFLLAFVFLIVFKSIGGSEYLLIVMIGAYVMVANLYQIYRMVKR